MNLRILLPVTFLVPSWPKKSGFKFILKFLFIIASILLVVITCCKTQEEKQLQCTNHSKQPIEIINMCMIQIIWEPTVSIFATHHVDSDDENATDEASCAKYAQIKCHTKAPHPIWCLVIEEFLHPNYREDIADSKYHVLWNYPPQTHWNCDIWQIYEPKTSGCLKTFHLD